MGVKAGILILLLYLYGFAQFKGTLPTSNEAGIGFGLVLALTGFIWGATK